MKRFYSFAKENPVWIKVLLFSMTLFLVRLADAVISYWAPNQIQSSLNSPVIMGIIISFQSVVGFAADLVFPSLLKTTKVRRLIFLGLIASGLTALFLASSAFKPFILIFLITMALWGVYYEFIAFANYQFMGSFVPITMRSAAWGVDGTFVNLAYFLGPLIGAYLLLKGTLPVLGAVLLFLSLGLILLVFLFKKEHEVNTTPVDLREINPWVELKHWATLAKVIWPAMVISLILGFIDSTFWTTGAIWTEHLSKTSAWGGLFLPIYQLPAIFLGLLIAKWGIYKGKKILTEKIMIVAGIGLAGLAVSDLIAWQLAMVLFSSIALAVCYPLIQGVYTDIVARMGREKKDMIGLTSSTVNVAYIVWPPVAGVISGMVGERMTFGIVGVMTVVVAVILLFVTPKKLRLPQSEIRTWG